MAMLQLGMGETGVAETGFGEPAAVDKFLGGAKVWLNPGYITTEMTALWAGVKADAVGTLTSPRALGFLLVPAAAILALVLWSGAAKRRRARNPRRRRAAVRRRRANPRRRAARGRRRNPAGKRSKSRGTHKNPGTVPGISKWSTFAGGTGAAEGKYGYDFRVGGQTYTIQPYTTEYGRHAGYLLSAYPGDPPHGHQRIGSFRSPGAAAAAARKFHGAVRHDSQGRLL